MLNTANYWRNVDQNYNEVSSHTGQNGHGLLLCRHKSLQITNARERNAPLLLGMQIGTATVGNSMKVPLKTKNVVSIQSCNSTHGHISRNNYNLKIYIHPYDHSSTIHNSQDMETVQLSTDRWMDKEEVVHMYNEVLLSLQKRMK